MPASARSRARKSRRPSCLRVVVDSVVRPTARGGPLGRLVDAQVKHRATVAALVLLTASALSAILDDGLR